MKEIKAHLNYLRISPRKVRLVSDLIKGKKIKEAESVLKNTTKRSAHPILKLLNSAVANAIHNFRVDKDSLSVKTIVINKGPTLKRFLPRARGMTTPINKRSSHITIILISNN
ncbi:MAG: 50S ribosomal protein L22 [Patescibacteria group bacterium]